jgi:hypothetical protein
MQLVCGIFSVVLIVKTSMGYIGLRKYSILYDVVYHDLILEQLQCDYKLNRNAKKTNRRHCERRTKCVRSKIAERRTKCVRSKIAFCRRDELDTTHPC